MLLKLAEKLQEDNYIDENSAYEIQHQTSSCLTDTFVCKSVTLILHHANTLNLTCGPLLVTFLSENGKLICCLTSAQK